MVKHLILGVSTLIFVLGSYLLYARTVVPLVELPVKELDIGELPPQPTGDPGAFDRAEKRPDDSPEALLAREAFGPESWEADAPIRMYWKKQGVVIFADDAPDQTREGETDDPNQTPERDIVLKPFSMLFLHSKQGLTTLRCPEARLQFAEPVTLANYQSNEIIGGQFVGEVVVLNRRGTPDPADDFRLTTRDITFTQETGTFSTNAPVAFRDGPNHGFGIGLDLIAEEAPEQGNQPDKLGVVGIRAIVLRRDVQMRIELDRDGGFLTGRRDREAPKPSDHEEPSFISVQAKGSLHFNMKTNTAVFRRKVRVKHPTASGPDDTLDCDRLEIVFVRQDSPGSLDENRAGTQAPGGLAFHRLRATGKRVVLRSPEQNLECYVTDLQYDAQTKTTLLADTNEVLLYQGKNEIHCRQLVLKQGDGDGAIRDLEALGPGWLQTHPEDGQQPLRVRWDETLRVFPQDQFTVLAFLGNSRMEQADQMSLAANEIYLWLEPTGNGESNKSGAGANSGSGFEIDRLLADGDVRMASAQIDGRLQRLEVWFEDAPEPSEPQTTQSASRRPSSAASRTGRAPLDREEDAAEWPTRVAGGEPLHVQARLMQVKTLRSPEGQVRVAEFLAHGDVYAYREAKNEDDKPIKLWGEKLWVTEIEADSALVRIDGAPAHVESDALILEGKNINFDYAKNHVWVNGAGSLTVPVRGDPGEEGPADKKPMRVDWQRRMFFNGEVAEFGGDVEIDAEGMQVSCQIAEVTLAEPISFRDPPESDGERIAIKRLRCDEEVVLDLEVIENGELQGRDHAEVASFTLDNETGDVEALGPGFFLQTRRGMTNPFDTEQAVNDSGNQWRTLDQRRAGGFVQPASNPADIPPADDQDAIRYTRIQFEGSMKGNTFNRRARFSDRVEVAYGPVEDFGGSVDPNHLPDRGMWMRSSTLEVLERPARPDGSRPLEMRASGKVRVETREFFADADRLNYDETKDLFVLEGTPRHPATLWRQERYGAPRSSQRARKFMYWRREGRIQVSDTQDGNFIDLAPRRRR